MAKSKTVDILNVDVGPFLRGGQSNLIYPSLGFFWDQITKWKVKKCEVIVKSEALVDLARLDTGVVYA